MSIYKFVLEKDFSAAIRRQRMILEFNLFFLLLIYLIFSFFHKED